MRALFVIPNLSFGGIQTQVLILAKHLIRQHQASITIWGVYTKDEAFTRLLNKEGIHFEMRTEIDDFFSPRYRKLRWHQKLFKWNELRKRINQGKFKVIFPYTHNIDLVFNTIRIFTKANASFSFERGGEIIYKSLNRNKYSILAKLSSPIYVSNSFHGKKLISVKKGIDLKKVHVIRNHYPVQNTWSLHEKWDDLIAEDKNLKVVMTANFFDEKDHETLIRAWKKVSEHNNVKLFLAGEGKHAICKRNIVYVRSLVRELQLENKIFFLGQVKNIHKLHKSCDIGVLSSKSEGCPNVILEYMGAKLPIVASNIPGIKEILPEENHCYLFEVGNVEQCASLLIQLILDKNERISLGELNYNYVMKNFSTSSMCQSYSRLLMSRGIL